ncbi:MAG: hypothetical protein JXD19_01280 [Deltaproteobacteria bacterium]|nr:hypothetical protein [Deltaproteobacteria bacterium]
MENVITRVVETEKQCSGEVEKAEQEYREKIEAHKNAIEKRKEKKFALIISAGNEKLEQALQEGTKQTEAASLAARKVHEGLYRNTEFKEAIKEKVVSILLGREG